ncbi:MAG: hypothetical protein DMG07_22765 [Acidobacteria bacterium]|nr:MAG: hypothetical protein DMG07_22765 [Acidobacteriota bacterium]
MNARPGAERWLAASLVLLLWTVTGPLGEAQKKKNSKLEATVDHYGKWLNEDVVYLATDEEKAVFRKLHTPEEKDQFIEQFWTRRDPDPNTAANEYKEEHYRRLAYANDHFAYAGRPGWMTDRGMVYIKFGKPDQAERFAPGNYTREFWEGGGTTVVYPFERWWYRYLEGVGPDVEVEFVDPTLTGEFRIATDSDEKDMLLFTPMGQTTAEERGLVSRANRLLLRDRFLSPANVFHRRQQDMPFERLFRQAALQGPPPIIKKHLQEIVKARVTYNQMSLQYRTDLMRLDPSTWVLPVTVRVPKADLQFEHVPGFYRARVEFYISLANLGGRVIGEAEDTVKVEYSEQEFGAATQGGCFYQKSFFVPVGLYKLNIVVKDAESSRIGSLEAGVPVARPQDDRLALSSIMLSPSIRPLDRPPERLEPFVLGDLKIIPTVDGKFLSGQALGVYVQLYNAGLDQTSEQPSLAVRYQILKDGQPFFDFEDSKGRSIRYVSDQRIELRRQFSLKQFPPGKYEVRVTATDQVKKSSTTARSTFEIVPPVGHAG